MKPCHNCGIASSYNDPELRRNQYKLAISLNHRGEEGTGLCADVGGSFLVLKRKGMVRDVFPHFYREANFRSKTGFIHNRYSTAGRSIETNLQPIHLGHVAVGHNGTLINTIALREKYSKKYELKTETDTELMACIFEDAWEDLLAGAERCFDECVGSYNIVVMNSRGEMAVLRDPWAIHPLFIGFKESSVFTASEDCALFALGIYDNIEEVKPGEVILFRKNGIMDRYQMRTPERLYRCFFEPIYFMSYGSTHKGKNVSDIRIELGKVLAVKLKQKGITGDFIAITRDSGTDYSEGCHQVLGIPVLDAFARNRYVGRTYLSPEGKGEDVPPEINFSRREKAMLKNPPIPERVRGRRIIIPDDSKVRGNTSSGLNEALHRAGAKEIHEAVVAPPIRYPCFLGMDHAERKDLVAARGRTLEETEIEVSKITGSTTTTYLGIDDLRPVLNDENDHCWACLTGEYPFELPPELMEKMRL